MVVIEVVHHMKSKPKDSGCDVAFKYEVKDEKQKLWCGF